MRVQQCVCFARYARSLSTILYFVDNFIYGLFIALLGGTALLSEIFLCIAGNVHKHFHGIGLVKGLNFSDKIVNV